MANLIVLRRRLRSAAQIAPHIPPIIRRQRHKPLAQSTSNTLENPSTLLPAVPSSAIATIETPSPPIKSKKAHIGSQRRSRKAAKDVLFLTLEALSQSSDVFPPLNSVVGGLLFFTRQAELVSSNKEQVVEIYAQIDAFTASLVHAIPDATMLSPTQKVAIRALADDVNAVCLDMKAIERQSFFLRFLGAKRHSSRLSRFMRRLDRADQAFTRTLLSSVEGKSSEVLSIVHPLRDEVHSLARESRLFFFEHSPRAFYASLSVYPRMRCNKAMYDQNRPG